MTRYATVRLVMAAVFAMLLAGAATALVHVARGSVGVGAVLLSILLGFVGFAVCATVLLFDSRRRHQLVRVLRSLSSDRLLTRDGTRDRFRYRTRYRSAQDEREPRDEQRAEMRRRLDYALEGLRRSVVTGPATAGATGALARLDDGGWPGQVSRELPPYVTARLAYVAVATPAAPPARGKPRLPASAGVARGASLVRVSACRYRQGMGVAAARTRLTGLRADDRRLVRRAAVSRWLVRAIVLLLVPASLIAQALASSAWFASVWDGGARRDGLLAALALGAGGSVWGLVVTRPEHGLGKGSLGEAHAVRSLLAVEQLALRLAVGVTPSDAWHVVARANHFPPGSAMPAAAVDEALAIVEQLRLVARRRHQRPTGKRIAAVARPVLICLLPAAVTILAL